MVIAPLNGGPERTLLKTPESEGSPAWSPDGRRIAFSRSGNGPPDVWVVDTDGQNATNLTHDEQTSDGDPAWHDASAPLLPTFAVNALGKLLTPWAGLKRR